MVEQRAPLRILFHHRIRSKDGQFVHLEELTRALRREGHEVLIVGPRAIESEEFGANAGVIDLLKRLLPGALYEIAEFAYSIPAYIRLVGAIRRFRPDVIYERYQLFFPVGVLASRRFGLPLLVEVNAPLLEERSRYHRIALRRLAAWSERFVWNGADVNLPVTDVLADRLREVGVEESRIEIIPNGIDERRFESRDLPDVAKRRHGLEDRTVLGFVGFIRDWHGLDRVVRYIAERPELPLHLLMVGDGPEREPLESLARRLGVHDKVTVTGIVGRDEVANWLSAFDVALQPDATEYASPLKLFEYLYVGLAVLAPRTRNLLEVLSDGANAVLFDRDLAGDFEAKLDLLVNDRALRQRIGTQARATIVERDLTWNGNARKVASIARRLSRS